MNDTEQALNVIEAWQRGETARDAVITHLTALERDQGGVVTGVIATLTPHAPPHDQPQGTGEPRGGTLLWREELMNSRARTWTGPDAAGLLVGPTVLLLTDGRQGVVIGERDTRALSASVSASVMLLCQTIVMAQHALDERDVNDLRKQRVESTSTSMSEIEIIR
ncbi:hypothetical protein LAJ19_19095 (plasmid) [Deinococcus taeanensis]|uniref:hypothetical protein n=1 Tax=Deinococcus taeanensis TaxID=2737050 RepID=UPI001CDD2954|nr:hypothetical protein [Deinococcus taeanensis]UBV44897.1 hypothetical protein LAJ19_19095 [Deinococcus taeanensis]